MKPRLRVRYTKIENLVSQLLLKLKVQSLPIPVEKIASQFGITIQRGDLGDKSGLLVREKTKVLIGVNSTQSRTRQRFTIAHELGHFFLHRGISRHIDDDKLVNFRSVISEQATNVEEIEANFFAANLLMPKLYILEENIAEILEDQSKLIKLAKKYNVSPQAMTLRISKIFQIDFPI